MGPAPLESWLRRKRVVAVAQGGRNSPPLRPQSRVPRRRPSYHATRLRPSQSVSARRAAVAGHTRRTRRSGRSGRSVAARSG